MPYIHESEWADALVGLVKQSDEIDRLTRQLEIAREALREVAEAESVRARQIARNALAQIDGGE